MSRAPRRTNISSRRLEKFLQSSQLLIDSLALAQRDLKDITVKAARQAIDQRVELEAPKVARKAAKIYKDEHSRAAQNQARQMPSLREMTVDPALLATPNPVYISPYI
ncbi:hypothetical protein DPSP01_013123 [Paraphaeosphaeria sporulosa]